MFGNNPIRGLEKGDGSKLYIQKIFPTFQGEGPFVGVPSVFIRLGGCNLACSFCDTEFESFEEVSLADILNKTDQLSNNIRSLVVITGGEPFRQNIAPLCDELIKKGYKVQIETNGTLYRDINENVNIVCSPKNTGTGYKTIRQDLLKRLDAIKFIVSSQNSKYADICDVGQLQYEIPVYIQPMDEHDNVKNKANINHAMSLAEKHNAVLSIQTHKILDIE